MKKVNSGLVISMILSMSIVFSSCEIVGDILQAGIWLGIIGVVLVVALIFWLIRKVRK